MFHVPIRSRIGNGVLGVLGALYFLSATGTLVYYVVTSWGAASLVDRVLQGALIVAGTAGLLFMAIAAGNLGLIPPQRQPDRSRDRQRAAAGES